MTTKSSSSEGYMRQLDGVRFFAVSGVIISHYTMGKGIYDEIFTSLGTNGVNLFFVLSGFLITGILLANKESTRPGKSLLTFYARRFLRIFPLYYLVIAIAFFFNIPECRAYLGWFVSYLANIPLAEGHGHLGYLSPLWSLSVEEQFYIFFPFIVLLSKKSQLLNVFLIVAVSGVVIRAVFCIYFPVNEDAYWMSYALTPGCLDCFGAGAILAYLKMYELERMKIILQKNWLFIASLFASLTLYAIEVFFPYNVVTILGERAFFGIFAFWLVGRASLADFEGLFGAILNHPAIVYLGKISYGLYVYHMIVPFFFQEGPLSGIPHVSYPFVTVAAAAISWHLYEHPINNLKKYFSYKKVQGA